MRERAVLFVFLGVVLTILLASLVLTLEPSRRIAVFDEPSDWQSAVPEGWLVRPEAVAGLDDADVVSYVIGYASGKEAGVALVVWDRSRARYVVSDQRALADIDPRLSFVTSVRATAPGAGASPAAEVTATISDGTKADFFVVRSGNGLRVVQMVDGGGNLGPAVFVHGLLPDGQATFELRDVNGDGAVEAVTRGVFQDLNGQAGGRWSSVDVYVWRNGRFEYDKELSWALTTEAVMFPEPSGAPVDTNGRQQ